MRHFISAIVFLALPALGQASWIDGLEVGGRYVFSELEAVNYESPGFSDKRNQNGQMSAPEIYASYRLLPWLSVELGSLFGSTLPKYTAPDSPPTLDEYYFVGGQSPRTHLTLKGQLSYKAVTGYLGVGAQYASAEGQVKSEEVHGTITNYAFDPGCGCLVVTSTDPASAYIRMPFRSTNPLNPVVQLGLTVRIWKGLTLGLDGKWTPLDTLEADLKKSEQVLTTGGSTTVTSAPGTGEAKISRILRGGATLSWMF